jgi:hypothetical protein
MSRVSRFAQPAEVTEPVELLRAGVVFHARGLINARSLQHNLDWIWPFWVERQFDPGDVAFVPRAFSLTHVNLTHRNWTALGLPGWDWLPIVDPAGLLTPFYDSWSVDAWVVPQRSAPLHPSRAAQRQQELEIGEELAVNTTTSRDAVSLHTRSEVVWANRSPCCQFTVTGDAGEPGWLVLAIRPANPEGISFIHQIDREGESTVRLNETATVQFEPTPQRVAMSTYRDGDIAGYLPDGGETNTIQCDVGLATAAVMFPLNRDGPTRVTARLPLRQAPRQEPGRKQLRGRTEIKQIPWRKALDGLCGAEVPDKRMQFLFDAAVRSLILHSPGNVYPGPYTYRRFWFRDTAFILEALMVLGRFGQVRSAIEQFPQNQGERGYFRSQQGEWDSNGQAIRTMHRYRQLTGMPLSSPLMQAVERGARWIWRKRLSEDSQAPEAGLFPAGFSAEHLGPIDFYYWDDFWGVAGLESAAALCRERGEKCWADRCQQEADRFRAAIERTLQPLGPLQRGEGVPASPHRRMDAGAIGSLAAAYPLQVWNPTDPRLLQTADWLLENCMVDGGFFQDMIHSGINAYLTLHLAQVLLAAGDERWWPLMRTVARLATETGQWPEAIHPWTRGGCMGDGQHIWAAAEWVMMLRACFVRERGNVLVLASGIPREWLEEQAPMRLGPTATPFGPVEVKVTPEREQVRVSWDATWRDTAPTIEVRLPGTEPVFPDPAAGAVLVDYPAKAEASA